jgi:hypothetical protein
MREYVQLELALYSSGGGMIVPRSAVAVCSRSSRHCRVLADPDRRTGAIVSRCVHCDLILSSS